jgi:glyoxylase-like metal-dependent hydrolase (beta-lactamase superfamily II)
MNSLEQQLHYPLGERLPEVGEAMEVAPGVRWIRMRLPFALNHINLWLIRDTLESPDGSGIEVDGWTVVDCCIHQDEAKAQWEQIFATQLGGLPILRVIVTHMHPDHIGLAAWLCERWQARLWCSSTDYFHARLSSSGAGSFGGNASADFFASHGLVDPEAVAKIRERSGYFSALVPSVPAQYRRMRDGDHITLGGERWACISGHGHAPEHISLYCERLGLLIGGDMMLPRISSNVSVYDIEPECNALALFLDSLDKFKLLPADTLALPSHGKPFVGIHTRVDQLHDHHRQHLAAVVQACQAQPCSAADILPVLFTRALDLHQTTFAMGEAIAHLHFLWFGGQLQRRLDAQGVYRFSPTPTPPAAATATAGLTL